MGASQNCTDRDPACTAVPEPLGDAFHMRTESRAAPPHPHPNSSRSLALAPSKVKGTLPGARATWKVPAELDGKVDFLSPHPPLLSTGVWRLLGFDFYA